MEWKCGLISWNSYFRANILWKWLRRRFVTSKNFCDFSKKAHSSWWNSHNSHHANTLRSGIQRQKITVFIFILWFKVENLQYNNPCALLLLSEWKFQNFTRYHTLPTALGWRREWALFTTNYRMSWRGTTIDAPLTWHLHYVSSHEWSIQLFGVTWTKLCLNFSSFSNLPLDDLNRAWKYNISWIIPRRMRSFITE